MDNVVLFYYLSASDICPDKRVAFGGSGLIRGGLLYAKQELLLIMEFSFFYSVQTFFLVMSHCATIYPNHARYLFFQFIFQQSGIYMYIGNPIYYHLTWMYKVSNIIITYITDITRHIYMHNKLTGIVGRHYTIGV